MTDCSVIDWAAEAILTVVGLILAIIGFAVVMVIVIVSAIADAVVSLFAVIAGPKPFDR